MYAIIYFDFDRQKKSITPFKIYKNLRFDFGKDGSFLFSIAGVSSIPSMSSTYFHKDRGQAMT